MAKYTTEFVRNLTTGEPLIFDVPDEELEMLARQKVQLEIGTLFFCDTEKDLVLGFEFSLFSAFEEIRKIFSQNGFTEEILTNLLEEFGVEEVIVKKILEDEKFLSAVRPWFEGIACDGERAARTIKIVYCRTLQFFRPYDESAMIVFKDFGALGAYMVDVFNNPPQ